MSNEVTSVAKEKKPSFFKKVTKFVKDLKSEAKKVVWPTPKQVINNTWAVIISIIIVGIFVGGLDMIFGWIRDLIIRVL